LDEHGSGLAWHVPLNWAANVWQIPDTSWQKSPASQGGPSGAPSESTVQTTTGAGVGESDCAVVGIVWHDRLNSIRVDTALRLLFDIVAMIYCGRTPSCPAPPT